jgi:hypothetical protein
MLPAFDEHGNLPSGIHICTMPELEARFGTGSPERQVETTELRVFVTWAKAAGVARLIVDGSYVTSKESPNDVDVVILPGTDYPRHESPALANSERWPFVHVEVAVDVLDFEEWADRDFGIDRNQRKRGVVEINL